MAGHCHELIKKTAQEMAASIYEDLATNNVWYAAAQREGLTCAKFVAKKWPMFVPDARTTLARLLGTNISDVLKSQIEDALILDNSLSRGRRKRPLFRA